MIIFFFVLLVLNTVKPYIFLNLFNNTLKNAEFGPPYNIVLIFLSQSAFLAQFLL